MRAQTSVEPLPLLPGIQCAALAAMHGMHARADSWVHADMAWPHGPIESTVPANPTPYLRAELPIVQHGASIFPSQGSTQVQPACR